jgi:hypothetical protein
VTTDGVHSGGMRRRDGDDEVIRALREGRTPDDRPELAGLASLMAELRSVHDTEPAPPIGPELAELIRSGAPAGDRSPAVDGPGPSWSSPLRSRRAKVGFAAVAASLGLVGGLGAAGALPAPVQRVVASTADVIGLDFPRPPDTPAPGGPGAGDGSGSVPAPTPAPSAQSPTTSCPTPSSSTSAPSSRSDPMTRPAPGAGSQDRACAPASSSTTTAPASTTTTAQERRITSTTEARTSTSSPRPSTTARSG